MASCSRGVFFKKRKKIARIRKGSTKKMSLINQEYFLMGTKKNMGYAQDHEYPVRKVFLDAYYIDQYAVSNKQFKQFVKSTNYKTDAETFGWSFVFWKLLDKKEIQKAY